MFDIHREEIDWGGKKLILETGRIARQADGAVLATLGETTVLATVVSAKSAKEGIDFLPADRQLPGKGVRRRHASRAATSSAKAARPSAKRSSRASSTVRSARCSLKAIAATRR
jgi:ribonuclease PH